MLSARNSKLPLFSIVVPTLNQGRFITQTIASVLSQDYSNFECLVIDGGSTDSTLEILRGYEWRLRWLSERDTGQSSAINRGWRQTQGDIIAWLNSDDTYLPQTLSRVAELFVDNPSIMAVYGNGDYVDTEGRFIKPFPTRSYNYDELVRSAKNYIPQPATFIRREVFDGIGGVDESLHYLMDFDYWLRLGIRYPMAHLPVRLATLRLHSGAKSTRDFGRFASELVDIYQRLLASPDLPVRLKQQQRLILHNVYYNAAHFLYWANSITEARHFGVKSWRKAPLSLRWLWLLLFMGRRGLWLSERVRGNPYRLAS